MGASKEAETWPLATLWAGALTIRLVETVVAYAAWGMGEQERWHAGYKLPGEQAAGREVRAMPS